MHRSMEKDLSAFCEDSGLPGILELKRVALTPDQRDSLGVLSDPKIKTASHDIEFNRRGLGPAAQLEAVDPPVLREMVKDLVEGELDIPQLKETQARELNEYRTVDEALKPVNETLREAIEEAAEKLRKEES